MQKIWVLSRLFTWHHHVDRLERLRGVGVTRGGDVMWRIHYIYTIYLVT